MTKIILHTIYIIMLVLSIINQMIHMIKKLSYNLNIFILYCFFFSCIILRNKRSLFDSFHKLFITSFDKNVFCLFVLSLKFEHWKLLGERCGDSHRRASVCVWPNFLIYYRSKYQTHSLSLLIIFVWILLSNHSFIIHTIHIHI